MQTVKAELGANGYDIRIGGGALAQAGRWLREILPGAADLKTVIITDTTVKSLYASVLEQSLVRNGINVTVLEVPPGEAQKTLKSAGRLYDGLSQVLAERTTPIIALGGGVVGDLAGFVAATYMRGVPLVQAPTTLLAMVDSSIGGKTAVNQGRLKNIVGAFYQPRLVVADIDTLKTLPEVELTNGLAEVIKSAAIEDRYFFEFLENNIKKVKDLDPEVLQKIVVQTARIKAEIVARDEREDGLRAVLNFGHTVGHALETVSNFRLKHGQAVAIGMVVEARIAHRAGWLDRSAVDRLLKVIQAAGLPAQMPKWDGQKVLQAMGHDKKVRQGRLTVIVLTAIGQTLITSDVDPALVAEVISGG